MLNNIIQGIKNLLYWFPIIWKDRNFDQHFIYEILKHKLKYQSKSILKNNIHTSAERNSRIMNICISLINKVQSEFYLYEHLDYFKLTSYTEENPNIISPSLTMYIKDDRFTLYFNKYKRIFKKQNTATPIAPKQRLYAANEIAEYNHNKAKNLLFKTIKENIDHWWD
jgi:hypothetical protein